PHLNFQHAVFVFSSSATRRACSRSGRRHRVLHPVHFHFRHHVLRVVSAAEKTATAAATLDFQLENRRSRRDQRRHSRIDRQCKRNHGDRESSRQRKDRDGEI